MRNRVSRKTLKKKRKGRYDDFKIPSSVHRTWLFHSNATSDIDKITKTKMSGFQLSFLQFCESTWHTIHYNFPLPFLSIWLIWYGTEKDEVEEEVKKKQQHRYHEDNLIFNNYHFGRYRHRKREKRVNRWNQAKWKDQSTIMFFLLVYLCSMYTYFAVHCM